MKFEPEGPQLETARLLLRPPREADFDAFAQMQADSEAARFIGGPVARPEAWRRFLWQPGAWWLQGFGMFSVIDRATRQWLGQIGPWRPDGWPGNEIGWAFHPSAHGKGYASEAACPVIDWAFQHLGWDNIIHSIDADNLASQRLAERLGSRRLRQARMPPPFDDLVLDIWGQSRAEWYAR